jgi:hypothetical protein
MMAAANNKEKWMRLMLPEIGCHGKKTAVPDWL